MKRMVSATVLVFAGLYASGAAAAGVQYACANGDVTRAVEVQEPGSAGLACEVIYRKPNEGEPQRSIWRASNDVQFCRDKAVELIALLASSGWQCAETPTGPVESEAASPAAPEAADEATETLGEAAMRPSVDADLPDIPLASNEDEAADE
ncbi:MAG: hypothetical protein AAGL49_13290 [Pseudomonadota bacterium]